MDGLVEYETEDGAPRRPTRDADLLIRTLNSTGRPVSVVSDVSPHAVSAHLQNRALAVRAGVHGRSEDPRLLMPNPDVPHRALHQPGSLTPHGVLIGSSLAELTAARTAGLPFIGYAPNRRTATCLTDAGAHHLVRNLTDLLDALHR
ncbi:HAD family hydrolase [Streptomyces sp. NPDC056240]|uniref:HAD family hydrolase n=1 Tax=Streptomyces sp. NPDC056240 TaxID=3345759 RepID=UPI0035DB40FA